MMDSTCNSCHVITEFLSIGLVTKLVHWFCRYGLRTTGRLWVSLPLTKQALTLERCEGTV
jgi:hypothetical protein